MNATPPPHILFVTGLSGAGHTVALKALEDIGFETIDNMPLMMVERLLSPETGLGVQGGPPIAIGIDIRTRDFGSDAFFNTIDQLSLTLKADIIFLDCSDDELHHRYAETRHRHPVARDRPLADGILLERELTAPLKARAKLVLDTTGRSPGELKQTLALHYGTKDSTQLSIFVTSFAFSKGLPRQADLVFDVRFLKNPHYDTKLRPLTGRDAAVADYVASDAGFDSFFNNLTALIGPLMPRYASEGKSYLTLAVGCTGGRHRSVFVAEKLSAWLEQQGEKVFLHHRDVPNTQSDSEKTKT